MRRAFSPRRLLTPLRSFLLPLVLLLAPGTVALAFPPVPLPTVSRFTPAQGPVGSTVTIIGTNFRPPLIVSFGGSVIATVSLSNGELLATVPAGAQTGPIRVANSGGAVLTATNFTVGAPLPTVTLAATVPQVAAGSGAVGLFTLTLSEPLSTDVVVNYYATGSAVEGVDYEPLKGSAKIKAGRTSKAVKIVPAGSLGGAAKKVVKLTLLPGNGYTPATATLQKVKIVAGP